MIFINYSKIISSITDSLVSYISNLEELKYQYTNSLEEYKKLDDLYQSMSFNLEKFVQEYAKSSKSKKEYFKSIVEEIYEDKNLVKALFNETRNNYLVSIYSNNNNYPMLKDFMEKLKQKRDSLSLMLDEEKLQEIENKINEYIDFSYIFDRDRFISIYDANKYIDIIDSLDLDYDTKIQAMEMGIKEFNRLYNEKLEEEYASLKDMTVDGIQHLGYDYSEDFDFDGVENE